MSMKARQNGPRLGQQTHGSYCSARRTAGRFLSLETNSMAHTPRVLTLPEVGEASAELVSDNLPVLHVATRLRQNRFMTNEEKS